MKPFAVVILMIILKYCFLWVIIFDDFFTQAEHSQLVRELKHRVSYVKHHSVFCRFDL